MKLASKRIIPEAQGSLSQILAKAIKQIPNKQIIPSDNTSARGTSLTTYTSNKGTQDIISSSGNFTSVIMDNDLNDLIKKKGEKATLGEVKKIFNECFQVKCDSN